MKDTATTEEFFWQARDQLGQLMDKTDFHVASALMVLSYFCYSIAKPDQGNILSSLASLPSLNSSSISLSLSVSFLLPCPPHSSLLSNQKNNQRPTMRHWEQLSVND